MDFPQLIQLLEYANLSAASSNLEELTSGLLNILLQASGAVSGAIYLLDRPTGIPVLKEIQGEAEHRKEIDQVMAGEGGKLLFQTMEGPLHHDHLLGFPLISGKEVLGAVILNKAQAAELPVLQVLAGRLTTEIEKILSIESSRVRTKRMEALITMMSKLGSTLDRDQILRMIIESASALLNAEASSLFLLDSETGDLVLHVASNQPVPVESIHVPAGKGIIGHVVSTGETIIVTDTAQDIRHYTEVDASVGFNSRDILAVPMRSHTVALGGNRGAMPERIVGGLEAINKLDGSFNRDDAELLETLANQAATVLEVANLYFEANELFLDVIKALTAAIDAKDPYTVGHSQRVCDFSIEIALEMNLPANIIENIRIGSLFHDVGKIGVPDFILTKPGSLTSDEFDQIKRHTTIGANIMSQVHLLSDELPPLAQHHERLDGSGYPRGLCGDQITLTSQIVAVADVFDAMTSDRPYRKSLPVEEVFNYLQKGIGTQFNGRCVQALANAYSKGKIQPQTERIPAIQ